MARGPDEDERLMLPERSVARGTKVFIQELALYLHASSATLRQTARRWGILHSVTRGPCVPPIDYVTEQGALRLIVATRAKQGGLYQKGEQFHEWRLRETLWTRAYKAKKRAKRKAEQVALVTRSQIALAIPQAGTEDDSRGVCEAGGIGIAETPAVST